MKMRERERDALKLRYSLNINFKSKAGRRNYWNFLRKLFLPWCGVRDGKGGIDCSTVSPTPRRPEDEPKLCGGETLFLLGEEVFTPLIGEQSPLRISGVSSSGTFWWCFSNCGLGWRESKSLTIWLVFSRQGDDATASGSKLTSLNTGTGK